MLASPCLPAFSWSEWAREFSALSLKPSLSLGTQNDPWETEAPVFKHWMDERTLLVWSGLGD